MTADAVYTDKHITFNARSILKKDSNPVFVVLIVRKLFSPLDGKVLGEPISKLCAIDTDKEIRVPRVTANFLQLLRAIWIKKGER